MPSVSAQYWALVLPRESWGKMTKTLSLKTKEQKTPHLPLTESAYLTAGHITLESAAPPSKTSLPHPPALCAAALRTEPACSSGPWSLWAGRECWPTPRGKEHVGRTSLKDSLTDNSMSRPYGAPLRFFTALEHGSYPPISNARPFCRSHFTVWCEKHKVRSVTPGQTSHKVLRKNIGSLSDTLAWAIWPTDTW